MGLNGGVGKAADHLQVFICEKESEVRGKREHFEGGGERTPSLLNLAPNIEHYTKPNGVDYRLKERVVICKEPRLINLGS